MKIYSRRKERGNEATRSLIFVEGKGTFWSVENRFGGLFVEVKDVEKEERKRRCSSLPNRAQPSHSFCLHLGRFFSRRTSKGSISTRSPLRGDKFYGDCALTFFSLDTYTHTYSFHLSFSFRHICRYISMRCINMFIYSTTVYTRSTTSLPGRQRYIRARILSLLR